MTPKKTKILAGLFGLTLMTATAGVVGASAMTPSATSAVSVTSTADDSDTTTDTHAGPGAGETPLTGETADKVTAAAQAEYPGGTVDRVETDSEGVYEAHVTRADGSHVIVQVGADFTVTGTIELPADGRGPGGPGGPCGPGAGETALTGETADKVTAAAQAEYPGGTVDRVETDSEGVYEAHVTTADGSRVIVQVGEDFTVTGTIEVPAGAERGGRGPGGPPPAGSPDSGTPSDSGTPTDSVPAGS